MIESAFRLGIDVGGTFTDVCLIESASQRCWVHKVPTTPADQSHGIAGGMQEILGMAEVQAQQITLLAQGTTVATNAVLEGKLPCVGLITTQGFRDLLEIRRQKRPDLYDLFADQPMPLVPRQLRLEVPERISHTGEVLQPLDEEAVWQAAQKLTKARVGAIAVCFLYSYLNPAHERRAREIIGELAPDLVVCLSHEVLPEFREFERFSTTALNTALVPVIKTYVTRFAGQSRKLGVAVMPYIMQSNGGVTSTESVAVMPVQTVLSGPSAGVIGATYIARQIGVHNILSLDMGGTSTDVSLVENGTPRVTGEKEIAGYPIRVPMIDIHTIGAGGGSIARVDPGKHLWVGPESAGARPGPACYGLGGEMPTVTDANLALGRLHPERILGGRMAVHADRARVAIAKHVAQPLGLDLASAAHGMISVVNTNMALAARLVSVEKGYDPRDFSLVAFGGAGPLHAVAIAQELGVRQIIIPPRPGILCAIGLLVTDLRCDFSQSVLCLALADRLPTINEVWADLEDRARRWWGREGVDTNRQMMERSVDLRYLGQHFELRVKAPQGDWEDQSLRAIMEAFHLQHERQYGYKAEEVPVQLVNLRVAVYGLIEKLDRVEDVFSETLSSNAGVVGERFVDWGQDWGILETPVYARQRLQPGDRVTGPAILEQMDSTTVVPPDGAAVVANNGSLIMQIEPLW